MRIEAFEYDLSLGVILNSKAQCFMDIGGCRLLDGDGDGGGLVADLHVHLGGAGLDAVDGAGAGDRHGGPVTPPDSVGRGGVLGADHVELGEVAFLDGQFAVRDALAGDADGGVVRDRAVLVHLAGGPGDAERLGLVGLGLAVPGRVPRVLPLASTLIRRNVMALPLPTFVVPVYALPSDAAYTPSADIVLMSLVRRLLRNCLSQLLSLLYNIS